MNAPLAPVSRVLVLAALAAVVAGCAGSQLAAEARDVRALLKSAREKGAYNCAPRELALGEAHIEFADRELDQGDYFRAKDHLHVADHNAREAMRLSPADRCIAARPAVARRSSATDGDGDGVPDEADRCLAEPEDRDAFEDDDGCPELDNDRDGFADTRDRCPNDTEDKDGFKDEDGCPESDNDQDRVVDAMDRCPLDAEDIDGFEDDDGCPERDNDKDGLADARDRCPNEAGPTSGDGCPQKFSLITVTAEKIELKQTVYFGSAKPVIMQKSYALLDEVATALRSRPSMRVRIEGHTDSRGNRAGNVRLSQARADSVKAYLVGHGVAAGRLETKGFGPDQPIETNKTAAGRERNRRVEFVITQQ